MKYTAVLFFAFMIGCYTSTSAWQVDRIVGEGQPQAYKDGYRQGCDSGHVQAGADFYRFSKNVHRYSNNDFYRQGWDDGSMACRSQSIR